MQLVPEWLSLGGAMMPVPCTVAGTALVYTGRVAGAYYNQRGGGSNYLCLPNDPEYDEIETLYPSDHSRIFGTEYEGPIIAKQNDHASCAVCYDSVRSSELMIPAKTKCPVGWTREYYGYLMADKNNDNRSRTEYVCVDKNKSQFLMRRFLT